MLNKPQHVLGKQPCSEWHDKMKPLPGRSLHHTHSGSRGSPHGPGPPRGPGEGGTRARSVTAGSYGKHSNSQ